MNYLHRTCIDYLQCRVLALALHFFDEVPVVVLVLSLLKSKIQIPKLVFPFSLSGLWV